MPNLTYQILHFVYSMGLTIWFGGLFFAIFVLAPAVFTTIKDMKLAGDLVGKSLDIMRGIHMFAVPMTIIASGLIYEMYKTPTFYTNSHNLLILLMGLIFFYGVLIVTPRIKDIRSRLHQPENTGEEAEKLKKEFRDLHKTSQNVATGQFIIGIAVIFLS